MSKPQVTITLGRTGQRVVKRPQMEYDGGRTDSHPLSGSKRSVRERFGSNANNSFSPMNKRLRNDVNAWNSVYNGVGGKARIGQSDLRLKLMRKKLSRQLRNEVDERKKVESRERISRTIRSQERSHLRRISPTRSASELQPVDSFRKYYSYNADGLRSRSPYRDLKVSRGISPPRNIDELRQVPLTRPYDASRTAPRIMGNDAFYSSRPTGTVPTTARTDAGKPAAGLPPVSGRMPKISYMGEQPLTVASLLHSLGLGKYAVLFQAEEVDMAALRQMGDKDLKELGIPMGPRKKILLAIIPRSKFQQR
ncbi:uncharacterized protein LOC132315827 [Cornus florida]|uniref:uncharacterized protein LOC132315827 n=1 Tax=Cornus florida TaxID=4283 RepID=UPI0028980D25|nr:uncharacterized protein LOC132315827 [Cornus florida]